MGTETIYFIVKKLGKNGAISMFIDDGNGGAKQTINLMAVKGYTKSEVIDFWYSLTSDQKRKAYIVSKDLLAGIENEMMPRLTGYLLAGNISKFNYYNKKVWERIKEYAFPQSFFNT